ncbi:MAG TPA: ATP-binding protein [Acidobacteriota bacterium]|jgi:DNA replication protein DnaC
MPELDSCPACNDTGWRLDESGNSVRRCDCAVERGKLARVKAARIPARYEHCTLEDYYPKHPSQEVAKLICQKFVADFHPQREGGVLFIGSCGVGKTHLAVAVLKELIEQGVKGLFYDFRDLLRDIQHSWDPVSQASELEILRPVLEAELLVLDELGANKPTAWVQDTMTHIINSRYNDKRVTIFTSNFPDRSPETRSEDPQMRREETLTDRVGQRLRSRLYEMCKVIKLEGEDFRMTVRQAGYRF